MLHVILFVFQKPRKPPPPATQPIRGRIERQPPVEPARPAEPVKVKEEPKGNLFPMYGTTTLKIYHSV